MSRELWADETCEHGNFDRHFLPPKPDCECGGRGWQIGPSGSDAIAVVCPCRIRCPGGKRQPLDFDAIWRRYYETANRRFDSGLTYNELWFVVYGEKEEE